MTTRYDTAIVARFHTFVAFCIHGDSCPDCCWLWQGSKNKKGYGEFFVGTSLDGKRLRVGAHVFAWQIAHNQLVPAQNIICHNCPTGDNPSCVQDAHLWLGTYSANNLDAVHKGRWGDRVSRGEKSGLSKLKESDIPRIFTLYDEGASLTQLGKTFHVSKQVITAILNKKIWRHISETLPSVDTASRGAPKLQAADIPAIFALRAEGWTQGAIGRKFGVRDDTISRILARQAWKHIALSG